VVGEVSAIRRDRIQVRRVPAIAADERGVDPLLLGLFGNQVDDIVIIGQNYNVGFGCGNFG
jgi:hypothetical protein